MADLREFIRELDELDDVPQSPGGSEPQLGTIVNRDPETRPEAKRAGEFSSDG
jgi:hypothetical protein